MLTNLMVVIILQHNVIYFRLMLYVSYISVQLGREGRVNNFLKDLQISHLSQISFLPLNTTCSAG